MAMQAAKNRLLTQTKMQEKVLYNVSQFLRQEQGTKQKDTIPP